MRVPLCVLAVYAALSMSACATTPASDSPGAAKSTTAAVPDKKPLDPVIGIARLEVNSAEPRTATSVPMVVRVKVENRTEEPVTVERIDVGSVGVGPYTINSTSQNFHHEVKPGHVSVFPVWVQAIPGTENATEAARRGVDETIGGQEGSMMMRAAVYVSTPTRPQHRLATVQKVETSLTH